MATKRSNLPSKQDYWQVMDNVFIYQRPSSKMGVWQLHARINGELFRESLKTTDKNVAVANAVTRVDALNARKYLGKPLNKTSFDELCDDYLETIKRQSRFVYHKPTIERYYRKYFSPLIDDVCSMTSNHMVDYLIWRRSQGMQQPSNKTINRERGAYSRMMDHAVKRGWLSDG